MSDNESERTFTQEEVNRIVADRLKAEKSKIMRDVEQREAALNRRETLLTAKSDWAKRGLPADLLDALDLTNPDAIAAAEKAVTAYQSHSRAGFDGKQDVSSSNEEADLRKAFGLTNQ